MPAPAISTRLLGSSRHCGAAPLAGGCRREARMRTRTTMPRLARLKGPRMPCGALGRSRSGGGGGGGRRGSGNGGGGGRGRGKGRRRGQGREDGQKGRRPRHTRRAGPHRERGAEQGGGGGAYRRRRAWGGGSGHGRDAGAGSVPRLRRVSLAGMDPCRFEELCAEILEKNRFGSVERRGGSNDGGIDLLVHDGRRTIAVECKHWPATPVGRPVLQKLHSAALTERAESGIVMTSGRFTDDARHHARHGMEFRIRLMGFNEIAMLAERAGMRLTLDGGGRGRLAGAALSRLAGAAGRWMGRRLAGGGGGR